MFCSTKYPEMESDKINLCTIICFVTPGRWEYMAWTDMIHQIIRNGDIGVVWEEKSPKCFNYNIHSVPALVKLSGLGLSELYLRGTFGEYYWEHQRHSQSLSIDSEACRFFLWGFGGRDGRTGAITGCWSKTHWSSCQSRGLNSWCLRLYLQPGGRHLSLAWRFSLWNTRWLSLSIKRFVRKIMIIAHLALLAVAVTSLLPTSPLLSSLQCTQGVFVRGCLSACKKRRTFRIDFLSYFQLTSFSFFDEKVGGVSFIDLRSTRTALSYTAGQGSYRL